MNLSPLLALFGRSLRDDTRSKTLLWARVGIAAAVLFAILRAHTSFFTGGAPGLRFFSAVVTMNFIFICAAGMSYFASAITEEKEEGTLGMLRMTDLSPVAILLGKSTSRLAGGFLLLLVQVPFVMLAITLGGVRLDQVIGCYALLGAFLFFACNAGLLGSVLSPRTGVAALVTALITLGYLSWPVLLAQVPSPWQSQFSDLVQFFATPGLLMQVLDNRGAAIPIGGGVFVLLGGGIAAFLAAWGLFDRFSEDEGARSPVVNPGGRPRQSLLRARPSRAWSDAICWRDFYYLHGGARVAFLKSAAYLAGAIWLAVEFGPPSGGRRQEYYVTAYFAMLLGFSSAVVIFESLFATSRIYRLERKERTLSSLMILPSYYDALLKSKRRAVLLSLLPGLSIMAVSAMFLFGPFMAELRPGYVIWFAQGAGYLVAQLYFNHYLVAWFSLRMKWGGLPLALAISWLGNSLAAFVAALMFQFAAVFVLIIATVVATVAMRNAFRQRLEAAATEE
jgi:hypothetical protein